MGNPQEKLKKESSLLPDQPGVYKFLGAKNQILYIGKATSLKSRVGSYFGKDLIDKRSPIIAKMMSEARSIKFEKTDSVLEALLLESNLIKKFTPPYNTADKDQKSFNYVVITDEKFPRVLIIRGRNLSIFPSLNFQFIFGPFPHSTELKEALKIVRKIFPFRDKCVPAREQTPHPLSLRSAPPLGKGRGWGEVIPKPCFNYQLGLCPGVCVGKITEKDYRKTIGHIKTFFEGNKKKLIKDLEREMKEFSKKREFEKASVIKKKIFALKHINDIALIKRNFRIDPVVDFGIAKHVEDDAKIHYRVEAYDIAHISGTNMVGVMTVVEDGEVNKNEYRKFKIRGQNGADDTRALKEVLERRLKHLEWPFPNLIVVDGGVAQLNMAELVLKNTNLQISVVAVTKDERHKAKHILGMEKWKEGNINELENQILLANSESHRFAITFHRKLRNVII